MPTYDLRGTRCPLTLLKIRQFLHLAETAQMQFLFDDTGTLIDLPLYLKKENLWQVSFIEQGAYFEALCTRVIY